MYKRTRTITTIGLIVATLAFAGCGDQGSRLPAGMTGSQVAYSQTSGQGSVLDQMLGTDPGSQATGVLSNIDDPILAGYEGYDNLGSLTDDDVWTRVADDFDANAGPIASDFDDSDPWLDDPYYGPSYNSGWNNNIGYGFGNGVLGAASFSSVGAFDTGYGFADTGFIDTSMDPSFDEPIGGLADPTLGMPGFDPIGIDDTGFDPGFIDAGFDPGIADPGFIDPGFTDPGFVDPGFSDPGFVDAGFSDPGFVDVGGFDGGFVDTGFIDTGFDAGAGFLY